MVLPPSTTTLSPTTGTALESLSIHTSNCNESTSGLYSDDDASGTLGREYTGMFEGPEKTLEVVFRRSNNHGCDNVKFDMDRNAMGEIDEESLSGEFAPPFKDFARIGLRRMERAELDLLCTRARCSILSSVSNRYLDAYVLSESSLFVYPYMVVIKTCGTTTLLRCIATLIDIGRKYGLEIDWVGYSRKNFNFPGDQAFPHQSFQQELDYLYSHRNLCERLDGNGYTLGPVTGDHWFVFVADHTFRSQALEVDTDRVLNIMMFDIDPIVSKIFMYDEYEVIDGETKEEEIERISKLQTLHSGIHALCPGALIDPRAFEPCGYSMNAILFRSYTTIHITPESGSSYASFETNSKVGSYKSLISNVIRTFRPKRFVMTLMADEGGLRQVKENPLTGSSSQARFVVPGTKARSTSPLANISSGGSVNTNGRNSPSSVVVTHDHTQHRASINSKTFSYKRSTLASIMVEDDCNCLMGNWVLEGSSTAASGSVNGSPKSAHYTRSQHFVAPSSVRAPNEVVVSNNNNNHRLEKIRGMSFS